MGDRCNPQQWFLYELATNLLFIVGKEIAQLIPYYINLSIKRMILSQYLIFNEVRII